MEHPVLRAVNVVQLIVLTATAVILLVPQPAMPATYLDTLEPVTSFRQDLKIPTRLTLVPQHIIGATGVVHAPHQQRPPVKNVARHLARAHKPAQHMTVAKRAYVATTVRSALETAAQYAPIGLTLQEFGSSGTANAGIIHTTKNNGVNSIFWSSLAQESTKGRELRI